MFQKRRVYSLQQRKYVEQLLVHFLHGLLHESLQEFQRDTLEHVQARLQSHHKQHSRRYVIVSLVVTEYIILFRITVRKELYINGDS